MGIFTKTKREFGPASPAAKRAAMLATPDLVPWAETCLYQIGRSLSDFQRDQDGYALAEAVQSAEVLQAILAEVSGRFGELDGGPPGRL